MLDATGRKEGIVIEPTIQGNPGHSDCCGGSQPGVYSVATADPYATPDPYADSKSDGDSEAVLAEAIGNAVANAKTHADAYGFGYADGYRIGHSLGYADGYTAANAYRYAETAPDPKADFNAGTDPKASDPTADFD